MWEGLFSPFLIQIGSLILTLLQAMECQHGLEYFQVIRLLLLDELPWKGFPFCKFTVVLGAVVDICMMILLALGVDSGLATTHTLYLFVGMSFLLLSVAFTSLLTRGLVTG